MTCHGKERSPLPSCDFQVTLPISCFKKRPNRKKQLSCQQNGPPVPSCDFQVTLPISCFKTKGESKKKVIVSTGHFFLAAISRSPYRFLVSKQKAESKKKVIVSTGHSFLAATNRSPYRFLVLNTCGFKPTGSVLDALTFMPMCVSLFE